MMGKLALIAAIALATGLASAGRFQNGARGVSENDGFKIVGTDAEGMVWSIRIADLQAAASLNAVDDANTPRRAMLRGQPRHGGPVQERGVIVHCAQGTMSDISSQDGGATDNVRKAIRPPGTAKAEGISAAVIAMVCP